MGFLDHSTNNIIVDAVLTDEGRRRLSANNGSFSIDAFAFGDDEVDYGLIKKYGRAVGKEKISKNTPVFEGLTLGNLEQKYKLIGLSNPYFTRLPSLNLVTNFEQLIITPKMTSVSFNVKQNIGSDIIMEKEYQEFIDKSYTIELNDLFLAMSSKIQPNVSYNKIAIYQNVTNGININNDNKGTNISVYLTKKNITDAMFSIYKDPGNSNQITTYVKVSGDNTGCTTIVPIIIQK